MSSFRESSITISTFGLALSAIVIAIGCGGGGGGVGASGPPVSPATTMRANVAGDSWVYNVTANVPYQGTGTGTYTQALTADTYNGAASIRSSQTFSLNYPSGVFVLGAFSELGLNGQLLAVISSGVLTAVKSDTFSLGSTINAHTDVKGAVTEADGTVENQEYKVVGSVRVTVPAGTFDCWKVLETESRADGTTDTFDLWLAPEIGNWVKADAQTNYGGGQVFSWQAEMASIVTAPTSPASVIRLVAPFLFTAKATH